MTDAARTLDSLRNRDSGGGTALAPSPRRGLQQLLEDPKVQAGLKAVAAKTLNAERITKLVTSALYRTPTLAQCNPTTVLGALMASVSLGLEPNTPAGHAYLIPYKRSQPRRDSNGEIVTDRGKWIWDEVYECQFQIGYRGFIVLAYRSPRVGVIDAEAVHRNDHFRFHKGSGATLEWSLKDLGAERGPLVGSYCHVQMKDGGENFTVMSLEEIHRIRARSETYTSLARRLEEAKSALAGARGDRDREKAQKALDKAQKTFDETPWVQWEDGMGVKSVIKRHVNQRLPLDPSDMLRIGVDLDNSLEVGTIDLSAFTDVDRTRALGQGEFPVEALTSDAGSADGEAGENEQDDTTAGAEGVDPSHAPAGSPPGPASGAPASPPPAGESGSGKPGRGANRKPAAPKLELD